MGKAVVYDVAAGKTTDVVLPDEGARVGMVKHVGGSDYFFTNYAVENEAPVLFEASHHIYVLMPSYQKNR